MVAIDPITSYFGKADVNKEQALRNVLGPIKTLAEATGVTFIGLGHFNKRSDVGALHRVGGAVAMSGVARAVWLFTKDPEVEGQYAMLLGKGNLTKKRSGLKYRLVEKVLPTGGVGMVEWGGEDTRDIETTFETNKDPREKAAVKAEKWLRENLTTPMSSDDLTAAAAEVGIRRTALFTAKTNMDSEIRCEKRGAIWFWVPSRIKRTGSTGEMEREF
jgi:hypothetical protein